MNEIERLMGSLQYYVNQIKSYSEDEVASVVEDLQDIESALDNTLSMIEDQYGSVDPS